MLSKRAIPLFGTLLLLGVAALAMTSRESVAQNGKVASLADAARTHEQVDADDLLPSAPPNAAKVSTRNRRSRASLVAVKDAPAPTVAPAPTIRPVLNQKDIELKHRRIAEEVLRMMPAKCQGTLKNFYVRYDNPKQRGLAGKNSIIVSGNVPDDEFRALLVHEFGHVMDLGCLGGTRESGASTFKDGAEAIYNDDASVRFYSLSWSDAKTRRSDSKAADFVSGYAQWDPFEDLSETVAAYVLHREALKELALQNAVIAAKVAWIEEELFPADPAAAVSEFVWVQKRPWDITKLSYNWTAALQW